MTTYSHSRLSTFEHCPRQFQYRYLQKLTGEGEGIEAFLGKRVHEVLERLYNHVEKHGRPPTLIQVLGRFYREWEIHWHENVRIVKDRSAASYVDQGLKCLENYYRSHHPFDDGTLATEYELTFQIGPHPFRGVIDRLSKQDGTYRIHDYKTSGYLPSWRQIDEDRQLALYQIGLEQTYPDATDVQLVWHYLTFNQTLVSCREPEDLKNLAWRTSDLIDTIEFCTEFPTRPSKLCHWCDYKDICPDGPT